MARYRFLIADTNMVDSDLSPEELWAALEDNPEINHSIFEYECPKSIDPELIGFGLAFEEGWCNDDVVWTLLTITE